MVTPTKRSCHFPCADLCSFNTPCRRSPACSPFSLVRHPLSGSLADEIETKPSPCPVTTVSIAFDAGLATQRFRLLFCFRRCCRKRTRMYAMAPIFV